MARRTGIAIWLAHVCTFGLSASQVYAQPQTLELPRPPGLPIPGRPPAIYRLTLDQAKQQALAQNSELSVGRLNLQEKVLATSAAKRDHRQTAADYIQPNFGAIGVVGSWTIFEWGKKRQVKYQAQARSPRPRQTSGRPSKLTGDDGPA